MALRPALLLACIAVLAATDPGLLPSPRQHGWVCDPAHRLDASAVARCSAAAQRLADSGAGELVVVVAPDCGGQAPRSAGLALFNRWGVGHPGRNDGILILIALQERRAEILLGDGIDDDANVLRSQAVVDREILPAMRRGDLSGAVAAGAEAAVRELAVASGAPAAPATTAAIDVERPAPVQPPVPAPGAVAAPSAAGHTATGDSDGWPAPDIPVPALLAGGAATALGGGMGVLWWRRRRPRACPSCRAPLIRLDEVADDAHLDAAQRCEEQVGSVDYDVWACSSCRHVEVSRYGAWFTSYHTCPGCGARTAHERSTTITPASESFTGLERIDTSCAHCSHRETRTRVLPRIERRSSSGRSWSSGSGSGGSGGGSSSGRGGGGGW